MNLKNEKYKKKSLLGSYWKIQEYEERLVLSSSQKNNITPFLSKLLLSRNIDDEKVSNFLNSNIENHIPNPFILKDMKNAVLRTIKALNENEKIGIIGVSFKKGSDDIRESPSFFYINELIKTYKNISIFDELAIDNFKEKHNHIKVNAYKKISQLIKNSKTIIILLDQVALKKAKFNNKNIIDLRYIL